MKYLNTRTGVVIDIPDKIKTGEGWEEVPTSKPSTETTPKRTIKRTKNE